MATGIRTRHSRRCATKNGTACNCSPTYEAWSWSKTDGTKIRQSFPTLAAAKAWRDDTKVAVRKGTMRSPSRVTLREAWEAWEKGAKDGTIRNRSGDVFKPSALRGYAASMRLHVLEDLGGLKLSELSRVVLQDVIDRMLADGRDPSTLRNTLMPLRSVYRRAMERGDVTVNPTAGIRLPAVRGKRDRIASPVEATALLEALPESDRAVWATAMLAGLRLGELRALRGEDVDLKAGVIRVERSWDNVEGLIEPKSRAGRRTVPIVAALRVHLAAHKLRNSGELFFGAGDKPFRRDPLIARADAAWKKAKLEPLGLHEGRHTCASIFIAAGVNVKALSSYLGHASITITMDRYGHLMPGNETEAVQLVDKYLAAATGARSGAQGS